MCLELVGGVENGQLADQKSTSLNSNIYRILNFYDSKRLERYAGAKPKEDDSRSYLLKVEDELAYNNTHKPYVEKVRNSLVDVKSDLANNYGAFRNESNGEITDPISLDHLI